MAEKRKCDTAGCERFFAPGVDGWGGNCRMHASRLRRGSPLAADPNPVNGGGHDAVIQVHVSNGLKKHVAKAAGKVGLSRFVRQLIEAATEWKR